MRNPEREKPASEKEESSQEKGIFESETAEKIKALKRMKELVEMEGKEGVSIEEAKEVLGEENVLGPEDVEKCMLEGRKVEEVWPKRVLKEIEKIPYSKKDLEKAKVLGEMLVLRSSGISIGGEVWNTNMEALREKFSHRILLQKRWEDKKFFSEDFIKEWGWKLVGKEPMMKGTSYDEQEKFITDTKAERRRPVEIVYDTLLYWAKNTKPPFEGMADWSCEKLSSEEIVLVGVEKKENFNASARPFLATRRVFEVRIVINSSHPDHPGDALGVCPQR